MFPKLRQLDAAYRERGLEIPFVLISGTLNNSSVVRIEPPVVITREEIDIVLNRLEDTLRELRGTVMQPGLKDEWDATGATPMPALSQDSDDSSSAVA